MRKKRICTEFNQVERNGGEEGGRRMDVCGEIATQLENVNIVDGLWIRPRQASNLAFRR